MRFVYSILIFLYVISPYDLCPDFIAGLGWLDDIILLILTIRYFSNLKTKPNFSIHSCNIDETQDPFTVLGLEKPSSPEKIRAAYRKLANQYHPDKVVHRGYEYCKIAEVKFREIKDAYDKIKDMKNI